MLGGRGGGGGRYGVLEGRRSGVGWGSEER